MRKFFNIFLVFLLLFSTTGVAISKHYCGEILQSVSVNSSTESCCDDQDMADDCCNEEVSFDKTTELQLSQLNLSLEFSPYILYFVAVSLLDFLLDASNQDYLTAYSNSPPFAEQEIFLLDQSFLL